MPDPVGPLANPLRQMAGQNAEFNFRRVQPAPVLRRVVNLQPFGKTWGSWNPPSLRGRGPVALWRYKAASKPDSRTLAVPGALSTDSCPKPVRSPHPSSPAPPRFYPLSRECGLGWPWSPHGGLWTTILPSVGVRLRLGGPHNGAWRDLQCTGKAMTTYELRSVVNLKRLGH